MKSDFRLTATLLTAGLVGIGIAPVQTTSALSTPQLIVALTSQQFTVPIYEQSNGYGAIIARNENIPVKTLPNEPTLISAETGVNYTSLRDLLAAGNWQEADTHTRELMLKVAGRESEGWFSADSINEFSCTDLKTIDSLWVEYSNGLFGFSTQYSIYLDTGNKLGEYEVEAYRRFGDRVGWRNSENRRSSQGRRWSNRRTGLKTWLWLSYNDLTFNTEAVAGHLPVPWGQPKFEGQIPWGHGIGDDGVVQILYLYSRVAACKL